MPWQTAPLPYLADRVHNDILTPVRLHSRSEHKTRGLRARVNFMWSRVLVYVQCSNKRVESNARRPKDCVLVPTQHKQVAHRRQASGGASLLRLKTYVASAPPLAAEGCIDTRSAALWGRNRLLLSSYSNTPHCVRRFGSCSRRLQAGDSRSLRRESSYFPRVSLSASRR